jgi:hypothetical protein
MHRKGGLALAAPNKEMRPSLTQFHATGAPENPAKLRGGHS